MPGRNSGGHVAVALTSIVIVTAPTASAGPPAPCPAAGDAALICAVNAARRERARPPLKLHADLARAARRHARDMVRRRYFSHVSPRGRTMVDRLRAVGYLGQPTRVWAAGEVLAWWAGEGRTAAATVDAWMRSPSHRRVLLGRAYREIGVGIAPGTPIGGPGSTWVSELGST